MNSFNHSKSLRTICGLCVFTLLIGLESRAATNTWDGGGANNFWSSATNWVGDVAPVAGNDLVFPPGAARLSNTNNFPAGTTFNSITFSGGTYTLYGSNILLNAGINATSTAVHNHFYIPLTLNSNQTITTGNMGVNLYLYGGVATSGKDLTFAGNGGAQVSAVISGAGGLIKTGSGGALFYASNTFSGPVQLLHGTLNIYHPNALGATNGSTIISNGAILTLGAALTGSVPEPFVLEGALAASSFPKTLTGPVTLSGSNALIAGPFTFNGLISGSGGFTKDSSDTMTLNANNTYAGTTTVEQGLLLVNGTQPASPIVLNGATASSSLGGTGTVGTITASGSFFEILAPGTDVPGILTCSNVTLNAPTHFRVRLNGTMAGTGYDQLNVTGTVNLAGASLSVVVEFNPALNNTFTIINNDGGDAVTGMFSELPEGAIVNGSGKSFQITYSGGDGNDVVLTRISPPARFASITALNNGAIQLQVTGGLSGFSYTIEAATNLNPVIQWSNLGAALANPSSVISFTDTNAPLFPMRFYRVLSP